MQIGRLEQVPLRELWAHEAQDFTTWLAENIDFLSDKLGIVLSVEQQEAPAGSFVVDILASDETGETVVIENQLERTDHDHLGKLITYLSNFDAKRAIWIARDPRPEHEKSVHWLNEALPVDTEFYLLKIEAYRIGDSPAAPLLTIVAGPSPEAKQIGEQKKELAERHVQRLEFWRQLLERANQRTNLHARVSPCKDNWLGAGSGMSGLAFNYVIRMDGGQVELFINAGEADLNKQLYDQFFEAKDQIEEQFGEPLEWQRMDQRKGSRIAYYFTSGGLKDRERWPQIQDDMADAMVRLENALKPHIRRLRT